MRTLSRTTVFAAVLSAATVGLAVPAGAAGDDSSASTESACVVATGNAVRASLTLTSPVAEDVAYNRGDPDAEDSQLELIRYPDEVGLWNSVDAARGVDTVSSGSGFEVPEVRAFIFTGPERQDRAISDSIVRLYCGLFDRKPDSFELEYWVGRYYNGLPLVTIAESFTHSQEFVARYGRVPDSAVVTNLYQDVLDREPGVGGVEAMVAKLNDGTSHVGQIIVQFTESGEYVRRTGTATPEKPLLPYPDIGSGRRILMSESGQRVWLVEASGELYKTHQVSGRRGIPGVGRYNVYSMSRYAWAPHDGITMEFMVRFARGEWPYGFHSIPVWPDEKPLQVPAQLGTHRSGGCVRQLWNDAEAVFGWAEIGDRVILFA